MTREDDESIADGWLADWLAGQGIEDPVAREEATERLYTQLRRLVGHCLNHRRREITLQTTDQIHQLFLQLVDQRQARWQDKKHFFAVAGLLLRRLVVDYERRRRRLKRGRGQAHEPLDEALQVSIAPSVAPTDLMALDRALTELETIDQRAAQVVELRYFAGMSHDETAEALGVGRATVGRSWRFARAWLRTRLDEAPGAPAAGDS